MYHNMYLSSFRRFTWETERVCDPNLLKSVQCHGGNDENATHMPNCL